MGGLKWLHISTAVKLSSLTKLREIQCSFRASYQSKGLLQNRGVEEASLLLSIDREHSDLRVAPDHF